MHLETRGLLRVEKDGENNGPARPSQAQPTKPAFMKVKVRQVGKVASRELQGDCTRQLLCDYSGSPGEGLSLVQRECGMATTPRRQVARVDCGRQWGGRGRACAGLFSGWE